MRYGSVCSGIEAATVAWHDLGFEPQWFSEVEKFPKAVLAHHYPGVPDLGDMTKIHERKEFHERPINLLVGGTPCQSFSVAGLRKGLADPRGNLALHFLKIADAARPQWLVWENVPGVLSVDGGRAFGAMLGGMVELGYGVAWRVLDAQHFGIPQRRRRVFVVGYLGDWRRAAAVLFERQSLSGNSAPSRETRQGTTSGFETGPSGGGFTDLAPTMDARAKDGPIRNQLGLGVISQAYDTRNGMAPHGNMNGSDTVPTLRGKVSEPPLISSAVTSKRAKGSGEPAGDECQNLIALDDQGGSQMRIEKGEQVGAMRAHQHQHQPIVAYENHPNDSRVTEVDTFPALSARAGTGGGNLPLVGEPALENMTVRRLTPGECEKLQGFPPRYTLIPWGKGMASDGPRYKALGNSMAVPVMRWIGKRIQEVEKT